MKEELYIMEELVFKYIESDNLIKFDPTFKKYSFGSPNNPRKERFILSKYFQDGIIVSSLEFIKTDYGYRAFYIDGSIVLVEAGENIYYLANYSCSKKNLINALYNFIIIYNSVIDVTKFHRLFKNTLNIFLGKKIIAKEGK